MPSKAIVDVVYNSVSSLPAEICRLVGSYVELSHVWTDPMVLNIADTTRIVVSGSYPNGWRTLVSDSTFETAHRRWTVDLIRQSNDRMNVGVGVTVRTENSFVTSSYYVDAAYNRDWILMYYSPADAIDRLHNNQGSTVATMPGQRVQPAWYRYRYVFDADPSTGNVIARIYLAVNDNKFVVVEPSALLVAAAADVFPLLRPSIVFYGLIDAMVRFGSSD